ncbi:MAG: hypothetical protein Q6373_025170 [Candidatus Sigynarchaeota archaeon]
MNTTQARAITSVGTKRSRVYNILTRVAYSLQLPDIMINHAIREYDRISKLIQRNTAMARPEFLAAICIVNVARKLGISFYRDNLLEMLGLQFRDFKRVILQAISYNKDILVHVDDRLELRRMADRVVSTVNTCIDFPKVNTTRLACDLLRNTRRYLIGMREDIKIAVISYLVIKKIRPSFSSLSCIASYLHCRISTIYNAITRVLKNMGITICKPLSKLDCARYLDGLLKDVQEKKNDNPM